MIVKEETFRDMVKDIFVLKEVLLLTLVSSMLMFALALPTASNLPGVAILLIGMLVNFYILVRIRKKLVE